MFIILHENHVARNFLEPGFLELSGDFLSLIYDEMNNSFSFFNKWKLKSFTVLNVLGMCANFINLNEIYRQFHLAHHMALVFLAWNAGSWSYT